MLWGQICSSCRLPETRLCCCDRRAGAQTVGGPRRLRQCEGKIATLTVINSALQKKNEELRRAAAQEPASHSEAELRVRPPARGCSGVRLRVQAVRWRCRAAAAPHKRSGRRSPAPGSGAARRATLTLSPRPRARQELQEEFTRRLAAADRTIASLKVRRRTRLTGCRWWGRAGLANAHRAPCSRVQQGSMRAPRRRVARRKRTRACALRRPRPARAAPPTRPACRTASRTLPAYRRGAYTLGVPSWAAAVGAGRLLLRQPHTCRQVCLIESGAMSCTNQSVCGAAALLHASWHRPSNAHLCHNTVTWAHGAAA